MNTESDQKEKLKRLKEGKTDLTKLTLEKKNPPPVVSRTTARKSCSVTSSTKKKPSQKTSEVGANFSGQSVDFKPEPIVQLPIEVKSQPDANYLESIEERKRERKRKQAERFKRKRLQKKRELIESTNSPVSIDDKKDDILRVSTIHAIDKSEVKKSDIPNVKDIESTAPKSELEKKVWDNIIKDLEEVQDVCSDEMTEKETVQAVIMEFQEEEPSDWEDREPLEAEIAEEDEGDDTGEIHRTNPEGLSEECVVLLSSDDESNTDKEPKKLKEIPIDQKDLSTATEGVAHHTANAHIVDDSEVRYSDVSDSDWEVLRLETEDDVSDTENMIRYSDVSDSDSEGVLRLETEDDVSDTENMKDAAPVNESDPKEQEGVGRIDSVSGKAVDTKDDKQEDNGGDDLLKNPGEEELEEGNEDQDCNWEGEAEGEDGKQDQEWPEGDDQEWLEGDEVQHDDQEWPEGNDVQHDDQEWPEGDDVQLDDQEWPEGDDVQHDDQEWPEGDDVQHDDQEWPEGDDVQHDDQEWPEGDDVQHDDQEWPEGDDVQHDDQEWPEGDDVQHDDQEWSEGDVVQHDDQEWPEGDDVQHDDQEWPEGDGQYENQEWVEEEEQGTQQDGQSAQEVGDEDLVAESGAANMDLEDEVKIDDRNPVDCGPLEDYEDGQEYYGEDYQDGQEYYGEDYQDGQEYYGEDYQDGQENYCEDFQDVDENVDQTTTEGDKDKENSEDLDVTITPKDCHKIVGDKPNQKADGTGMKVHITTTTSTNQPEVVKQSDGNLSTAIVAEANLVEEKPSSPKVAKKLDSNKLMKSVQDKQSGELGDLYFSDADSVNAAQEELEEGEINFHLLGQGPSQKLQIVEEKSRGNGSVSSIASPVVSASDVSSLAESRDSQMDESSVPDKNVASLGLESAETKFDLLFKSTGTSNSTASETLNDLELSTPAKGVLMSTSNAVEAEVESKANGTRANAGVALIQCTSVDHDDAPPVSESIQHYEDGEEIVKKSEEQVNDKETTENTSVNAIEASRESTDDIRLQLDFSSSDEEKPDKISSTISELSSSLIGKSLTSTLPKTNLVSTKNFVEKDEEQKKKTSTQVTDGVPEVILDDKGERKDQENTSRKRFNDVNLEVFVWEKSPKKAKHHEESEVEDTKVSLEAEDTEEYKEFRVPTLPKLITMHDLENIIKERMLNYVEECNKTIVDTQNERIDQLEKQLERWKKRATFLESQVKEAESKLEIYNKVTATTSNAATYSNTESPTSKPTSNLVGTLTRGARKSTTTPAMSMSTRSRSLTMSRNIPPPTSISVITSTSKPTTAVPLQLIANTSLTRVKKSTTAPKTKSATPGPKSSATVIDLTEEEEDKSGNKNASVISSPNRTVALKPNAVKSGSGARSILKSPSMTINTIPVDGGGLSISLSSPRSMAQPTATRPKQAMTVTTKAPIPRKSKTHPAELPAQPNYPAMPSLKLLPPRPFLKVSKVANGIVLSWNMKINATYADIILYQLYAYQETSVAPNPALWKKLGDVKPLPLPMACTLTNFVEGNCYYFAVRAVDKHDRIGPFSEPTFIILHARR